MATWDDLAKMNMASAKLLHDHGKYRPSVTRSYYASYCALTARLWRRHHREFRDGNNPDHGQLIALVRENLELRRARDPGLIRVRIGRQMERLFNLRVSAEYVPGHTVERAEPLTAVQLAANIQNDLEVMS